MNRSVHTMVRSATVASILVTGLFAASSASAQARMTFVPSVSFGAVYDDNLFAHVDGSAGQMFQVRPSFEGNYESPTLTLLGLYSFDMQRSNFSSLNTLDARRHALGDIKLRTTPMTMLGLTGRYDRSETPGEIDIDTGILGARRQAERLQLTPSVMHRIAPRTVMTAGYDFTTETLVDDARGTMHTVRTGLSREWSTLTSLSGTYVARYFIDGLEDHSSHAMLLGWHRLLGPGTRFEVRGGPRLTSYGGIAPEVAAGFGRATPRIRVALDYWHGETIILGVRGPVAVDSGTARVTWPLMRTLEFGTHAGVSDIITLDQREARVYRGTLVSSWTPHRSMFTVAASYGIDYQQGEIRRNFSAEENVLRHVIRVSVTVAPRLSRSILPPEEAARAKGVLR
jgi:hypothetical protein